MLDFLCKTRMTETRLERVNDNKIPKTTLLKSHFMSQWSLISWKRRYWWLTMHLRQVSLSLLLFQCLWKTGKQSAIINLTRNLTVFGTETCATEPRAQSRQSIVICVSSNTSFRAQETIVQSRHSLSFSLFSFCRYHFFLKTPEGIFEKSEWNHCCFVVFPHVCVSFITGLSV